MISQVHYGAQYADLATNDAIDLSVPWSYLLHRSMVEEILRWTHPIPSQPLNGPSMSNFYKNLERIQHGQMWIQLDTLSLTLGEMDEDHARSVVTAFLAYDLEEYYSSENYPSEACGSIPINLVPAASIQGHGMSREQYLSYYLRCVKTKVVTEKLWKQKHRELKKMVEQLFQEAYHK